jgi:hypothetical protein
MSTNLAVTIYALGRVLHHLSEEEQGKQPRYRVHDGCYKARAAARVIIKRRIAETEQVIQMAWDNAKGGELD